MNLLVAQSGGPTAVLNQSLMGVVDGALASGKFGKVYGSPHGLQGLLRGGLVDLGRLSPVRRRALRGLPGAFLGSHRFPLGAADFQACVRRMSEARIGAFAYIGGNGSMHTTMQVLLAARNARIPLLGVGVPKTVDNDLSGTDHSPGFGSAARHNALAVYHAGLDSASIGLVDRVKVIEVMGRDTGWLAAGSALARSLGGSAPHLIIFPERPLRISGFLAVVKRQVDRRGHCVIVASEGARDGKGRPLSASTHSLDLDGAGQVQYGGAAQALARLVRDRLRLKAREEKYGTAQRVAADRVSEADAREAYGAGAEAVRLLLKGTGGVMVTLVRKEGRRYGCGFGSVGLEKVARKVRALPGRFIAASGMDVTGEFLEYAGPLAGFRAEGRARA